MQKRALNIPCTREETRETNSQCESYNCDDVSPFPLPFSLSLSLSPSPRAPYLRGKMIPEITRHCRLLRQFHQRESVISGSRNRSAAVFFRFSRFAAFFPPQPRDLDAARKTSPCLCPPFVSLSLCLSLFYPRSLHRKPIECLSRREIHVDGASRPRIFADGRAIQRER